MIILGFGFLRRCDAGDHLVELAFGFQLLGFFGETGASSGAVVKDKGINDSISAITIPAFIALNAGMTSFVINSSAHFVPLIEIFLCFR